MQPGVHWFGVLLDDSKFAVRFWLCDEHLEQFREHFALIDQYGYEPPKKRS
ncbi:hypothetical protein [Cryptosporangium sp. NPDC048952]|uniref:hypothetical protein n=1 Tax=Cryptosporangium sp. NPDC048952 TaxID=3363961 RepID=UPI003711C08F